MSTKNTQTVTDIWDLKQIIAELVLIARHGQSAKDCGRLAVVLGCELSAAVELHSEYIAHAAKFEFNPILTASYFIKSGDSDILFKMWQEKKG